MRPSLDELAIFISNTLGPKVFCSIASCKFVGNTDQWVARLVDHSDSTRQYYRIAEGFGTNVTFISPRMPSNVTTYTGQQSKSLNRDADRKMRELVQEVGKEVDQIEQIQLDFGSRLEWLFEGRDG